MFWFQTVLKRFETPGHLLSVRTLMCVECQLFIIVLKLQRETEKNDHEHFLIFNPLPRQYNSSLYYFFSSDQRLVSQCPVQPSCRRHEVPGWKTDCAYPGRYYIYLQIYCITQGRVYVRANNRVITMFQSPTTLSTMYVGGVFNLTAGDVITFLSAYANFRVFMYSYHTYFGAYLI